MFVLFIGEILFDIIFGPIFVVLLWALFHILIYIVAFPLFILRHVYRQKRAGLSLVSKELVLSYGIILSWTVLFFAITHPQWLAFATPKILYLVSAVLSSICFFLYIGLVNSGVIKRGEIFESFPKYENCFSFLKGKKKKKKSIFRKL